MNLSRRELLAKYLDLTGQDVGPFAILGLTPGEYSAANIDAALRRRLDELRAHADGASLEADQVRLALRKAADDLNDPSIRSVLDLAAVTGALDQGRSTTPPRAQLTPRQEITPPAPVSNPARSLAGVPEDRTDDVWAARDAARGSGEGTASSRSRGSGTHALDAGTRHERQARRRELIALATVAVIVLALIGVFFTALVLVWPRATGAGTASGQAGTQAAAPTPISPGTGNSNLSATANGIGAAAPRATSAAPITATETPSAQGSGSIAVPPSGTTTSNPTPPATSAATNSPLNADPGRAVSLPSDPRAAFLESALVIKRLRDAAKPVLNASGEAAVDRAAALFTFKQCHAVIRDWWCDYDPGANRAATESALQTLYALNNGTRSTPQSVEALSLVIADAKRLRERLGEHAEVMSADEVARASWAVGFLSRLSRERDVPPDLAASAAAALNEALGHGRVSAEPTFESGATGVIGLCFPALIKTPALRLNTPPALIQGAIDRWLTCLDAVLAPESAASESIVLDALHAVATNPREPEDDLVIYQSMERLTLRLRWRDGAPARTRLVDFFDDPRVSVTDLRVITGLLAAKSGAPGVDATMVLPMGASDEERALLKRSYVQAWNLAPTNENERLLDEWRTQADRVLADTATVRDPALRLYGAAVFARLNQAAHELWIGNTASAQSLLNEPDPQIPAAFTTPARVGGDSNDSGGEGFGAQRTRGLVTPGAEGNQSGAWAEKFLSAERSIPLRLEHLKELETLARPLSHADAQVLVETACIGVPQQVQASAQRLVTRDANDVAVLAAVLEFLPRSPKTRGISIMVEKLTLANLPAVNDPQWDFAARRALLGRLLSLMAASSTEAWQESLAERIAASYLAQAGEESGDAPAEDALRAARVVRARWRGQAEKSPFNPAWGMSIQQLGRRAEGRLSLSAGPVQAFAAEQTNLAETVAYVVAAERLARTSGATEALRELAESRRAATHVYEQVWASERAITRLWRLRLTPEGTR